MQGVSAVSGLQDWYRAKQAPRYEKAMETFQQDLALIQSWDQDPGRKMDFLRLKGQTVKDENEHPGEVSVMGVGSLKATREGFELVRKTTGEELADGTEDYGEQRTYQINNNGTITVSNLELGGTKRNDHWEERYLLDTNNGIMVDYSWGQVR